MEIMVTCSTAFVASQEFTTYETLETKLGATLSNLLQAQLADHRTDTSADGIQDEYLERGCIADLRRSRWTDIIPICAISDETCGGIAAPTI